MSIHLNRRQFVTATIAATALLESGSSIGAVPVSEEKRRIFACGSGILSPPNALLIQYVLDLTGKKDPVVCLLPTAVGDNSGFIQFWYEVMNDLPCRPRHLRLFGNSFRMKSFEAQLMAADVIFVGLSLPRFRGRVDSCAPSTGRSGRRKKSMRS
jgi:hypothetical protein